MAKPLNFNNVKKQFLTVTLADEKKTTLFISMPTKAIMDRLVLIQNSFEVLTEDETNIEATNDLYEACAMVMSRNKAGIKITTEYLSELFDFEDLMLFFNAYMDFVGEISASKN